MFKEFKEFALKGNVLDLAVGIIIGAAFGKIVDSLVKDVIMPPLGMLTSRIDFKDLKFVLEDKPNEVAIRYGSFLNEVVNFTIVAFAVFLVVRQINRLRRKPENLPPATKQCPFCASGINVKATRCPQCTSDLPGTAAPGA